MENQKPKAAYLVFSAVIDQLAVQRFFALMAGATQEGYDEVHILMQSTGGNIPDGICLYNFFWSLPILIATYNCGSISSAGVTAYLGGHRRYVDPTGTFMIHRATAVFQGANSNAIQSRIPSLIMDDNRTEAILKDHVQLTPEQWAIHKTSDLWLDAKQAVTTALALEEKEFHVPPGEKVINVFP